MGQYASNTSVSSEKSRAEIESTLRRYGADNFGYMVGKDRAMIAFEAEGRQIKFVVTLPDYNSDKFRLTPSKKWERNKTEWDAAYEQAIRQKWRALALMVKAKLEAVESGIVTFEQEFLPHIVLPGGQTVYDQVQAGIEESYRSGKVRPLLELER